jgi:hypothetical protein
MHFSVETSAKKNLHVKAKHSTNSIKSYSFQKITISSFKKYALSLLQINKTIKWYI